MKWILATLLAGLFVSTQAFAHANLKSTSTISPRSDATGLKTAPCGGIARTNTPTILQSGSTITVQWMETINHPGRFQFSLSQANDQAFQLLKTVEDDQNDPIVGNNYHQYSTTITLPAGVTCTDCTLQLVQVMTENPANPSYYYSCADLKIQSSAAGTAPTPAPAPTAAPTGANCTP